VSRKWRSVAVDSAGVQNRKEHSFQVVQNIIVSEAYNTEPLLPKETLALLVMRRLTLMALAVDLDDQAMLVAIKIGDIRFDGMLPAEL
jgi:hypothetical protein